MSFNLSAKSGSRDSLKVSTKCGFRPCAFQILCTDDGAIPTFAASVRSLQWVVASGGVSCNVRSTTRLIVSAVNGLRPGGRAGGVLQQALDPGCRIAPPPAP